MELVDVTLRLAEPQVMELLTLSVGYPTPEKLAAIGDRYAQEPSWNAYALLKNNVAVGVIGFQITSPGCGRIRNIAVLPKARGLGHGRRLIEGVRERATLNELYAETDADDGRYEVAVNSEKEHDRRRDDEHGPLDRRAPFDP